MPKPRKTLVSLDATPYYHCVSRCVRRASLCGDDALTEQVNEWRERLMSISWFMRCANEPIAREANHEDNATGHFWAAPAYPCSHGTCASLHIGSRFKSQALLDEKALLACMAYVDLNPIRTTVAKTPEQSDHTSIQQRIKKAINTQHPGRRDQQAETLFPFVGYPRKNMPQGLPFQLNDYIELVDWSGRILRNDKKSCYCQSLS